MEYEPDYTVVVDAAYNKLTPYLPLYEHNVCNGFFDKITMSSNSSLLLGDQNDKREFFKRYISFLKGYGYDVVPFEGCVVELIQNGEGLMGRGQSLFSNVEDILKYPWQEMTRKYFDRFSPYFEALSSQLPSGMKCVGGVGNGIFETVQDFVPFTDLAYLMVDDEDAYNLLFKKVGQMFVSIWKEFLLKYSDIYAICRFGDDLGFKSSTLIQPDIIRSNILLEYKKIIKEIHSFSKPFLLHSCGSIFPVMEDIIACGIDAKHSNEDTIALFPVWVEKYGDRIGNFGGIDMNVLCVESPDTIKKYVNEILTYCEGKKGIAIGSGNQIADYVPPEGFIAMVETVNEFRRKHGNK